MTSNPLWVSHVLSCVCVIHSQIQSDFLTRENVAFHMFHVLIITLLDINYIVYSLKFFSIKILSPNPPTSYL